MLDLLITKCENLMTFISSNLYIHSKEQQETLEFFRLNIPSFLSKYMDESVSKLILEKEKLPLEKVRHNQVYLYIDPFKLAYLTWPILTDGQYSHTLTLGPLLTQHLTRDEIRYIGYKMKLPSDSIFILENFYGIVPYYEQEQLVRIASTFLDYLASPSHLPQINREDHSLGFQEIQPQLEEKFLDLDFIKNNYRLENLMLSAVEHGDVDFIKHISTNLDATLSVPSRFPSDPLREQKNLSITLNSICLRAAIKGGLSHTMAHNLSHTLAIAIEQQTSLDGLHAMSQKILEAYASSVRKYALKDKSDIVLQIVHYVRTHLTEKISLSDVATYLHMSREHVSRLFKEQMDLGLTDFIHKSKVEESCQLLTSRQHDISHIAYLFGYSSQAHYSKIFKQHMGLSPKQWQQKNKP